MNMKSGKTICLSILVLFFVVFASGVTAQTMKIAIPAAGPEENALISEETGRAPFFLFFDGNGHLLEAMKNPASDQSGGISRTVIALLTDKDVTILVARSIGDKMKQALSNNHINLVFKTGNADDAVKAVIQK